MVACKPEKWEFWSIYKKNYLDPIIAFLAEKITVPVRIESKAAAFAMPKAQQPDARN